MQKDILIASIVYQEVDIIKKHVDFLTKSKDIADIIVLENHSKNTNVIQPYLMGKVKKSQIHSYLYFKDNIGMNVFETLFNNFNYDSYKYIVVTDGDLSCKNNDWLGALIQVMTKYNDTLCCGVKLDMSNLPLKTFPEAKNWCPQATAILSDCEIAKTGLHLLMYRKDDFKDFISFIDKTGRTFMDTTMHDFCATQKRKVWRRTKDIIAYHHTWDLYQNRAHEYTKLKTNKTSKELWFHNRFCEYYKYHLNESNEMLVVKQKPHHKNILNSKVQQPTDLLKQKNLKLHIGCGNNYLTGWVNIDLESKKVDYRHDVTKPLKYRNDSVKLIYSEHFIEHLDKNQGSKFIRECHRLLNVGGVIRIATFDLDDVIDNCHSSNEEWREYCNVEKLGLGGCKTRAEFLNMAFHSWGHKYLYNHEELEILVRNNGFINYKFCEIYESDHEDFRNLETRFNSTLIIEAQKS